MHRVKLHLRIEKMISLFYRMGVWHRADEETVRERALKLFYSVYFPLGILSLIVGAVDAFVADNKDEAIFLTQITINCTILLVKLLYLIWTKSEILELLDRVCQFYANDHDELTQINNALDNLLTFCVFVFSAVNFSEVSSVIILPIYFRNERKLFFNIGFPMDWRNDDLAFWLADTFLATQMIFVTIALLFSVVVWYLMANCGLRYRVLGQRIKGMGRVRSVEGRMADKGQTLESFYLQDMQDVIAAHINLKEYESARRGER